MTAAQARLTLGQLASRMASRPGDAARARTLLEEALRRFRDLGHERWIGEALRSSACTSSGGRRTSLAPIPCSWRRRPGWAPPATRRGASRRRPPWPAWPGSRGAPGSPPLSEASLDDARAAGDRFMETVLQDDLGRLAFEEGDYPAARACFAATLRRLVDLNATYRAAWSLQALGAVDCAEGRPQRALRLMGAARTLLRAAQRPWGPQDGHFFAHWQAEARRALGAARPRRLPGRRGALPPGSHRRSPAPQPGAQNAPRARFRPGVASAGQEWRGSTIARPCPQTPAPPRPASRPARRPEAPPPPRPPPDGLAYLDCPRRRGALDAPPAGGEPRPAWPAPGPLRGRDRRSPGAPRPGPGLRPPGRKRRPPGGAGGITDTALRWAGGAGDGRAGPDPVRDPPPPGHG